MPGIRRRRQEWILPVSILGTVVLLMVAVSLLVAYVNSTARNPQIERPEDRARDIRQAFGPAPAIPGPDEVPDAVTSLFDDLGKSLRNNGVGLEAVWDAERMFEEARDAMPPALAAQMRRMPATQLRQTFRQMAPILALRLASESHTIRGVRWIVPGDEGIIIARHLQRLGDETFPNKYRWWVVRRPEGWRVYDVEEIATGMRMSAMMAVGAAGVASAPDQEALLARMRAFVTAQTLVVEGRFAEARPAMDRVDTTGFPRQVLGVYHLMRAMIEMDSQAFDVALRELDKATAHTPEMPAIDGMRACCHFALGQHERVIAPCRAYVEQTGSDGNLCSILGQALRELDRLDEAAVAFGQSLDDEPDNVEVLGWLRHCLRPEQKADLGPRFVKLTEPAKHLSDLVSDALDDDDLPAAEAFVRAFRQAHPTASEGFVEDILLCHEREDHDRALEVLRDAFATLPADRQKELVQETSWDFARAGQALAFYEASPPALRGAVFDARASNLRYADGRDDSVATLAELIDRHSREQPEDRKLLQHRGHLAVRRKQHDEAEKHFAAAMTLATDDGERVGIRRARIDNLLDAGKAREAYENIPPARATFEQIARQLLWKNPAELAPILALHRKAKPRDPLLDYVEGRLAYDQGRWTTAMPLLRKVRDRADNEKDALHHDQSYAGELLVRCLVNLGRLDEARDALALLKKRFGGANLLLDVLIEAMAGNVETVERELTLLMEEEHWWPGAFYRDPDLGPLLRTPAFAFLRERVPEPWYEP